ncbi:Bug family tripartite tricarboxylate transporter substrate binding protein [Elioraea rosea]|uniref:Bug family tripartite tricarboxylate transporter substrate binding protein n=1 Tax=Elioraea rosea TaxID=2492390 RepID=UPI001183F616|nr:tripartite tricarboxylate transporter substrate binding protein [Elioraea rosea]
MLRRSLLAAPALVLAAPVRAQGWPARPITAVVTYPPGGVTDTTARAICEGLARELGQPVVIENRPGAGTSIGSTHVARATPDGYTILFGATSLAINPTLQPQLTPKDPMTELRPIGMAMRSPFVLHVHPDVPAKTVAELIAYAKANPGKLSGGSSGNGAVNHLALELLKARAGIDILHVPYRGGAQMVLDLVAGRVQLAFQAALEAIPVMREGRTRGIAISSAERFAATPELPPVAATLSGFDAVFWQGVFVPAGTPDAVASRLEAALMKVTGDRALQERFAALGAVAASGDAAALRRLLAEETERWGTLIRSANITV